MEISKLLDEYYWRGLFRLLFSSILTTVWFQIYEDKNPPSEIIIVSPLALPTTAGSLGACSLSLIVPVTLVRPVVGATL